MSTTILCYEKCSTCKKALKWMDEKGYAYEARPIREEHPTAEELKDWYVKSGLPLKRFFNTSGNLYKELKLKDRLPEMSEEEQLKLLATADRSAGFRRDAGKASAAGDGQRCFSGI